MYIIQKFELESESLEGLIMSLDLLREHKIIVTRYSVDDGELILHNNDLTGESLPTLTSHGIAEFIGTWMHEHGVWPERPNPIGSTSKGYNITRSYYFCQDALIVVPCWIIYSK